MTDPETYQALITISLPDQTEASAHITLTPPDMVEVDGRVKPLSDCTMAELQGFADELEADVWDIYQSIKLMKLDDNDQVQIEIEALGQSGKPLAILRNWHKHHVLLPVEEADEAVVEEADAVVEEIADVEEETTLEEETVVSQTAVSEMRVVEEPEPIAPDEPDVVEDAPEEPVAVSFPAITIAESEPVHPENAPDMVADPGKPVIADSQARTRIAGTRFPDGYPTWMAVDILIEESALRAAQAHALSSMDREVAGVLVGPRPEKQPDGRYLVSIIDTIIAKHTVMHGASVTYTPESWRYLNDQLAERYPDETAVMVGWYHTHPGFGIFLSGMDQFIHQNFFTQIWHTALVLDPRARTSGFFCWDRAQSRVDPVKFSWPSWAPRGW